MLTLTLSGCAGSADQDEQITLPVAANRSEATDDLVYLRTDTAGFARGSVVDLPPAQPEALPGLPGDPAEDRAAAASNGYMGQLTHDELRGVLGAAGWPEHLWGEASAVSFCEAGYTDPDTGIAYWRTDQAGDRGVSVGLFQLGIARPGWQGWWLYFGFEESRRNDPVYNATLALHVYWYNVERHDGDGWFAWSCGYAARQ